MVAQSQAKRSDIFSSILFVDECLLDKKRTEAFQLAIGKVVKRGDIVLDAGTGSGVLALMAARAGAKKVYAVEVDDEVMLLAKSSFAANPKEGRKIMAVLADLDTFRVRRPVDVLVMELLDTGLITEGQASALNTLRRHKVIDAHTKLIPEGVYCALEIVQYDFSLYGFDMPLVMQARNHGVERGLRKCLSRKNTYCEVNFGEMINTHVDVELAIPVTQSGLANAVRLSTETVLHDTISIWETSDMNMPVVVPVELMPVKKGDIIRVWMGYEMGQGYKHFRIDLSKAG